MLKRSSVSDKLLNFTYYDSDLLNKIGMNKTPKSLYVHVPQGTSSNVHKAFVKTVSDTIQWNSTDARQKCATRLLHRLDKDYSDNYLQVLHERGYALSQLAPKMSANLWTAMWEDANLQTGQQGIINLYLSTHTSHIILVNEYLCPNEKSEKWVRTMFHM
jgi:hypothetical protein